MAILHVLSRVAMVDASSRSVYAILCRKTIESRTSAEGARFQVCPWPICDTALHGMLTISPCSFLTTSGAYDRNHGPIPYLDANTHLLTIDGEVSNPQTLTVPQLRDNYPQHEVISALQCAGNRRHTMRTMLKEVKGLDWCDGAVMNCSWRGPRLRDVLLSAGVRDKASDSDAALHVAFSCYQTLCEDDSYYGGSVELERVMNPDAEVILALEVSKQISRARQYAKY